MRDIGERAAMDEAGIVLQRLDEVGQQRVLEQSHHRACCLDVCAGDGGAVAAIADDDAVEALLKIGRIGREAEDRHDLGGDGDVEAALHRRAIARSAKAGHDLA